jgi:hypothetical protein
VIGAVATIAGVATKNPVLATIGSVMLGFVGGYAMPIGGSAIAGGVLGASVSFATSPVSPLDPGVKQAVGWAYTAYGIIRTISSINQSQQQSIKGHLEGKPKDPGVFLNVEGAGNRGHIASFWELGDGRYRFASVNGNNGLPLAWPNGFDDQVFDSFEALMVYAKDLGYDYYRFTTLQNPDYAAASIEASKISGEWYAAPGLNCLNDTYRILKALGVPDLPQPGDYWMPTEWFQMLPGDRWSPALRVDHPVSPAEYFRLMQGSQ